jgi:hypothetical protein
MIIALLAATGGLGVGILTAVAWTVGCRQGRADVLTAARALDRQALDRRALDRRPELSQGGLGQGGQRLAERGVDPQRGERVAARRALVDDRDGHAASGRAPDVAQP